jgi:hypothetical protein
MRVTERFNRCALQDSHLTSATPRLSETSFGTLEYAVIGEGDPMLIVLGAGAGSIKASIWLANSVSPRTLEDWCG